MTGAITLQLPATTLFPVIGGVWEQDPEAGWLQVDAARWQRMDDGTIEAHYSRELLGMLYRALRYSEIIQQTVESLRAEAGRRTSSHLGARTQRLLSEEHELVGLMGEWAFGRRYGYRLDLRPQRRGDAGVDFRTPLGTVDVKTARGPAFLWLPIKRSKRADLLFLAHYDDDRGKARLVGWEWWEEMRHCQQVVSPAGLICYQKAARDLRPVEEFDLLMWDEMPDPPKWPGPTGDWGEGEP